MEGVAEVGIRIPKRDPRILHGMVQARGVRADVGGGSCRIQRTGRHRLALAEYRRKHEQGATCPGVGWKESNGPGKKWGPSAPFLSTVVASRFPSSCQGRTLTTLGCWPRRLTLRSTSLRKARSPTSAWMPAAPGNRKMSKIAARGRTSGLVARKGAAREATRSPDDGSSSGSSPGSTSSARSRLSGTPYG